MGAETAAGLRRAAAEAFANRGAGSAAALSDAASERGEAVLAGSDTPAEASEGTGLLKGGVPASASAARRAPGGAGGRYGT